MNAKKTKVTLCVPKNGIVEEFEVSHAERLLRMKNNGGWQLPKNSEYQFSKENGLTKRDKKQDTKA